MKEAYAYLKTQIWLNSLSVANFGFILFVKPFYDICDLSQVMAYKMSQEFPTASLDVTVYQLFLLLLHVTVRPSDALGLKALMVTKKGGVGKVPPSIIYVRRNSSTLKIYISLCVNVFC